MIRVLAAVSLGLLAGCADQSSGAALNECRLKHFLETPVIQEQLIPDCMRAKSFQAVTDCHPEPDPYEWDPQVSAFTYNDPRCYQPPGTGARIATALSPL